jgi:hypothetical protein
MKFWLGLYLVLALALPASAQDLRLDQLPPVNAPLTGAELMYCVQNGHDTKCTAAQVSGANPSYTATGGTTARTAADRAADTINVMDYGAKCDSSTDDSAAINTATAVARASPTFAANSTAFNIVFPSTRWCKISSSLNFTGLSRQGLSVLDAHIYCATNNTPCIDALSSRFISWRNLNLWGGDGVNTPSYGIQIGRISATNADFMFFDRPLFDGRYTVAPFYNFASEGMTMVGGYIKNWQGGAGTYSVIEDGCNHFNITSAFVTQTLSQDTCESSNENSFVGGAYEVRGNAAIPIWVTFAHRLKFINSYACGGCDGAGTPNYGVVLYTGLSGSDNLDMDFDIHIEGALISMFLIAGAANNPVINGLAVREHNTQADTGVIALDTTGAFGTASITGATINDIDIKIEAANSFGQNTPLFVNPSGMQINGHVALPFQTMWTPPAVFVGTLCIGTICSSRYNWADIGTAAVPGLHWTNSSPYLIGVDATVSGIPVVANYSISPNGFYGLVSASRASDNPLGSPQNIITDACIAANDNTSVAHNMWCRYEHGVVTASSITGEHINDENSLLNLAASVSTLDPFTPNPSGASINLRLDSGIGSGVGNSVSAALHITNNSAKFNSGIVIGSTAIDTNKNEAIALATTHKINAYSATGTIGAVIQFGSGSPAGVVSCTARCLYIRTDGGANTTLYINETGGGTAGWAAK